MLSVTCIAQLYRQQLIENDVVRSGCGPIHCTAMEFSCRNSEKPQKSGKIADDPTEILERNILNTRAEQLNDQGIGSILEEMETGMERHR
jgi:hypothetical protein